MNALHTHRSFLTIALILTALHASPAAAQEGWTGNMARNPGFEEDFVNVQAEGHVLSFKADFYYNQKDNVPDYWQLKGGWEWLQAQPYAGKYYLKLGKDAGASQTFVRAVSEDGGGAWGGANVKPLPMSADDAKRFAQPWRVTAFCRGGGEISISCGKKTVSAKAPAGAGWQKVSVELPVDEIGAPGVPATVTLTGPGEFDDVSVQEKLANSPNLAKNTGDEEPNKDGSPAWWSPQQKFRAIGPTYYVWTDWNHFFRANRGPVGLDTLVAHRSTASLRFDVFPGDEKFVESDFIALNQTEPKVIEVGVYVRADRIKLLDVRCVDEEGVFMPSVRPRQPENTHGGSFLYGNGTFEWRYVRKFFGTPHNRAVKGVKVRLCARGMNGHTLDDAGTRPFSMSCGTVWWDKLHVCERTSTAAELASRGVRPPAPPGIFKVNVRDGRLDLGERMYGANRLTYSFEPTLVGGLFQLKLTTTLPGAVGPVETISANVMSEQGKRVTLSVPYTIDKLAGELEKQGTLQVELLENGKPAGKRTYHFNTWPVIADIDVSRHYNLPSENPVTVSVNLGVGDQTLSQVKKLQLQLVNHAEEKVLSTLEYTDLKKAFADTIAGLPKKEADSYEFNLPTPAWWVDRNNLIIAKIDLSPLKVWPHDQPTRDTKLLVRGLDAAGKELFRQESEPFCRMEAPPKQPPIEKVEVRQDGAVLINGQPRFLTGATHQSKRVQHTVPIIEQLGLMGHRLTQGMTFQQVEDMWAKQKLYSLQLRPANKIDGTSPVMDLTPQQRKEFEAFVKAGGLKNVISINSGGWEGAVDYHNPAAVAKHLALNAYIRQHANRPLAISTSGAYNAWWLPELHFYDINHAETEMWGPMDFNVIFTPYMKKMRKTPTAWVYLPQLYDNTPHERYRFETYENIIRGSAGVSMIQGIGDATFNRGLAGELRYLEAPLYSQEKAPQVTLEPRVSHKVSRYKDKTYLLTTNAGPVQMGHWTWNKEIKHSGTASHEGDSVNQMWVRPGGVRIHGFRGLPLPEEVQKGDKIVQYVWLDPKEKPAWAMLAVRGDGKFSHCATLGTFDFAKFREAYGNVLMFSELEHSSWHQINYVFDDTTYKRSIKVMGQQWADQMKKAADVERARVDKYIYQAEHFHNHGALPEAGKWVRLEIDADKVGLVGKLVDGFAYLTKDGRALWDQTVLERGGKVVRVFCEDSVGIDRALLGKVRIDVPGLKKGTKIKALFESRTLTAEDGWFVDDFTGVDTYGYEAGGVVGDMFGYVKDEDRELPRMIPSGYGYSYGPTAVHIYEIEHPLVSAAAAPKQGGK